MEDDSFLKTYDRVLRLIGQDNYQKIGSLKIGVAGCGILGQILPPIFSRIGVAEIRTLDKDVVKIENLPNSLFFSENHLGISKSIAAALIAKKYSLKKTTKVKSYRFDVTDPSKQHLLEKFLSELDLVFGCFDSLPPRFALNSAALKHNVKYIDLGIEGFAGRIRLIDRKRACYNCDPLIPTHQAINIFKLHSNSHSTVEMNGCDFAPTVSMLHVALMTTALAINIGLAYLRITGEEPEFDYYYFHLFGQPVTMKITKKEDCIICGANGEIWWKD
ncbi:MAG: ThiF family adenylyltransferase [Nitrososphaerota archaeon]